MASAYAVAAARARARRRRFWNRIGWAFAMASAGMGTVYLMAHAGLAL